MSETREYLQNMIDSLESVVIPRLEDEIATRQDDLERAYSALEDYQNQLASEDGYYEVAEFDLDYD